MSLPSPSYGRLHIIPNVPVDYICLNCNSVLVSASTCYTCLCAGNSDNQARQMEETEYHIKAHVLQNLLQVNLVNQVMEVRPLIIAILNNCETAIFESWTDIVERGSSMWCLGRVPVGSYDYMHMEWYRLRRDLMNPNHFRKRVGFWRYRIQSVLQRLRDGAAPSYD